VTTSRRTALAVLLTGGSAITAGTALVFPPAALIVGGTLVIAFAFLALDVQ
jgi:hypothetical protein